MKTIKIIDLLNKIWDREEREKLPYEVMYRGNIYKWCRDIGDYRKNGCGECLIMKEIFTFDQFNHNSLYNMLFDEVEILDETPTVTVEMTEKEYHKYLDWLNLGNQPVEDEFEDIEEVDNIYYLKERVNQLIKNQKKIIDKLKELEK